MKKRYLIFIFLILFSIGIFIINAAVYKTKGWHSGSNFKINVDSSTIDITLQDAINNNLLKGSHTYALPVSIPDPGHNPSQIWVSVNGNENTLLQALSSANKLCDPSPGTLTTSYSSSPTDKSKAYHFANQIEVTVGTSTMSFQEAIDNGKFNPSNFGTNCPSGDPNCINVGTIQCDGSCSGSYKSLGTSCGTNLQCDGYGNCVSTCVSNIGQSCDDGNSCTTGETIQCDGSCSGGSYAPKGTVCDTDKLCGLTGNCIDIRELVRESLGYREEWRATVETHTSCGGRPAFYSKEKVMDGNDDTYSWANLWLDDSSDPLTCVYDWTVSLPSSGYYSLASVYIRKIEFITAIDGTPGSAGRSRRLWLEYYDGSWHTSYDSGAVTNSEGKTTRTFYITDPTIQRVSKIRVRVEVKRTSKYQVIMHKTSDYSMKMFGITTSYG